ncbi:winged helix-turn-helix domain-containing protein [Phenylobacterium sp. LH3H17]|uniref:ArsR/SmtB family transcription factor n=1 Tax=Phenylobacterium sp. LH3H17 TaxID=2903901 RepID=UPI0020C978D1|nr:winged helix-turn-helix domain-containing protein [Phenylobacterium sp. LH3H17]UTP40281.1 winged helix-turn-helix domain-containing protein [Phenylobacterium sp. LH3H17]
MRLGPDIVRIAALLGDPARANMLAALMGGQALTAGELAREAGVTPQTASSHLAKLADGGLLVARRQGRHAYFALAGPEVADLLETLMGLAERAGHQRVRPGPREPALRMARVCYDHLAGELGVALLDSLTDRALIEDREGSLSLTVEGAGFMRALGVETAGLARGRRPLCKACLDWSVRRSHLGGALGKALLDQVYARGWARQVAGSRVVSFSAPGLAAFKAAFHSPP